MALLEEEKHANDEEGLTASTESDNVNMDEISSSSGSDLDNINDLTTASEAILETEAELLKMGFDPELVKRALKVHGESCSLDALVDFVVGHSDDPALGDPLIKSVKTFPPEKELDNSEKLLKMGFSSDAVMRAIKICGDADYNILVDSIIANELGNLEKVSLPYELIIFEMTLCTKT
ncbi:hypothetical protein O6H91_11G077800 [Diphasiastrum complanatum]|uniref:Uncharacterized protein n=1 Tax=Diphasiastrum complanatum TaxID=34168 RepID=A0ACC2CBX0_DIPCM|nr:hypothetical protein O6H91_11G077800 [Diphasiastrum complanatum]